MAEPTNNRAAIRRNICRELGMPFSQRYSNGYLTMDASSTTGKIIDSALSQKHGFWNGSWLYAPDTGDVSKIRSFDGVGHYFQLEVPLASSPSEGDKYEIHTGW